MNNVQIDIETLGTAPDAAIVSIGAVMFDKYGTGKEFYKIVDAQSSVDDGGTVTISTVEWWMKQNDKARTIFQAEKWSLLEVLMELTDWLGDMCDTNELKVWANSPAFDCVILGSAYMRNQMHMPWRFYNERCHRTMKAMYKVDHKFAGTAHNAVDDARNQALHLIKILHTHNIKL